MTTLYNFLSYGILLVLDAQLHGHSHPPKIAEADCNLTHGLPPQELTYDYRFKEEEESKVRCQCGAPNCKGYLN